jgi:hypothetical protein
VVATSTPSHSPAPLPGEQEREAILAAFRPRFAAALAPARSASDQMDAIRGAAALKALPLSRGQLAAAYRVAHAPSADLAAANRARAERIEDGETRQ